MISHPWKVWRVFPAKIQTRHSLFKFYHALFNLDIHYSISFHSFFNRDIRYSRRRHSFFNLDIRYSIFVILYSGNRRSFFKLDIRCSKSTFVFQTRHSLFDLDVRYSFLTFVIQGADIQGADIQAEDMQRRTWTGLTGLDWAATDWTATDWTDWLTDWTGMGCARRKFWWQTVIIFLQLHYVSPCDFRLSGNVVWIIKNRATPRKQLLLLLLFFRTAWCAVW